MAEKEKAVLRGADPHLDPNRDDVFFFFFFFYNEIAQTYTNTGGEARRTYAQSRGLADGNASGKQPGWSHYQAI